MYLHEYPSGAVDSGAGKHIYLAVTSLRTWPFAKGKLLLESVFERLRHVRASKPLPCAHGMKIIVCFGICLIVALAVHVSFSMIFCSTLKVVSPKT